MTDLIDTTEMYLRTILELEEENIVPLRARISERLGHSGPTVSQTVGRMERDGLVIVSEDRTLELTDAGRRKAVDVMRKHRLAERLLSDVIGLDWAYVHEEACRWEHVMSEQVERRLVELLGHPTESPYGNPIPGLDQLGRPAGSHLRRGRHRSRPTTQRSGRARRGDRSSPRRARAGRPPSCWSSCAMPVWFPERTETSASARGTSSSRWTARKTVSNSPWSLHRTSSSWANPPDPARIPCLAAACGVLLMRPLRRLSGSGVTRSLSSGNLGRVASEEARWRWTREDTPFRLVVFTAGTHKVPEIRSCHESRVPTSQRYPKALGPRRTTFWPQTSNSPRRRHLETE